MKNKLLAILSSIMLSSLCMFALSACEEEHTHSYSDVITPPKCAEMGFTTHKCDCGDVKVDTYVAATGHSFTNYVYDNNATCEVDGTETSTCDNCTQTDTKTKAETKLGHSFTNYVYDNNATCEVDGTETATCDNCTQTDTKTKAETKLGHSFTNYVYDNNATCEVDGTETATCDNCTQTDTKIKAETKLGHSFTNYVSDNNATHESDGTKTAVCDRDSCQVKDVITDEGTKLESNITFNTLTVDGFNVSGKVSNSTEEFDFTKEISQIRLADYVVSLDKYGSQQVLTKTVPLNVGDNIFYVFEMNGSLIKNTYKITIRRRSMYTVWFNENGGSEVADQKVEEGTCANEPSISKDGYTLVGWDYDFSIPITADTTINAIWDTIFYISNGVITGLTEYGKTLNNVVIPENFDDVKLTSIGDYAFYGCTSLTSIEIPDGITSLGMGAFARCSSLVSIEIPNSVKIVEPNVFTYCTSLKNVKFAEDSKLTRIEWGMFLDCNSLESIEIPDSVNSIGTYAFVDCTALSSITIGSSVTSFADNSFNGCYNLVEVINKSSHITVEVGSSLNGNLGYYATKVFNSGDTYVNKFTTESNGYKIYTDGCDKVLVRYTGDETELTLPSGITEISRFAFYENNSITSVTLPSSVKRIRSYAFGNCNALETIKFNVNKSEFEKVYLSEDWNLNSLLIKVICNDGEIDNFDNYVVNDTDIDYERESGELKTTLFNDKTIFGIIINDQLLTVENGGIVVEDGAYKFNILKNNVSVPDPISIIVYTDTEKILLTNVHYIDKYLSTAEDVQYNFDRDVWSSDDPRISSGTSYNNYNVVLTNDIDMSGITIKNITSNMVFNGCFDGRGYVIYNAVVDMTSNQGASLKPGGFFGGAQNCVVKNVAFINLNSVGHYPNGGLFTINVGTSASNNVFENIYVELNENIEHRAGLFARYYGTAKNFVINERTPENFDIDDWLENGDAYYGAAAFARITNNYTIKDNKLDNIYLISKKPAQYTYTDSRLSEPYYNDDYSIALNDSGSLKWGSTMTYGENETELHYVYKYFTNSPSIGGLGLENPTVQSVIQAMGGNGKISVAPNFRRYESYNAMADDTDEKHLQNLVEFESSPYWVVLNGAPIWKRVYDTTNS